MALFDDVISVFRDIEGLVPATYTSKNTGGSTNYSLTEVFRSQPTVKAMSEPAVKGTLLESLSFRFVASDLAATPKAGDEITCDSVAFEVGDVQRLRPVDSNGRGAFWKVNAARAFVDDAWDESIVLKRFTLSTDVAGSVTETASTIGTYAAIAMQEDDVADMINRLGVKGDKQAITFFVAQTVPALPMDFITYNSRDYRVTMIGDEGRLSRLKKIRVELYA